MEKYLIGDSVVIGKVVCKPSIMTEFSKEDFFKEIDKHLNINKLEHRKKDVFIKSNLRKGITIGSKFFLLDKIKSN